jgi:hypothetical protein
MNEIMETAGSVYAALGMPDAEEMLVKAQLATKIGKSSKAVNGASNKPQMSLASHNRNYPGCYAGSFAASVKPRCLIV